MACVALVAATPLHADAIWDALKAEADSTAPQSFTRTIRTEEVGSTKTTLTTKTDRFHAKQPLGKQWLLLKVDGEAPSEKQLTAYQKEVGEQPIPGFHRLSTLLAGKPAKISHKGQQVIYHWPQLAKGALGTKGPDISRNLSGEAIVDTSGPTPRLSRVRVFAAKPFSVMVVAKIRSFNAISEYETNADGATFLTRQSTEVDATIPFKGSGITRTTASFRPN